MYNKKRVWGTLLFFIAFVNFSATAQNDLRLGIPLSHTETVYKGAFSPGGKLVATISEDKTAKIWDVYSGKLIHNLIGHNGEVKFLEFSTKGDFLVTCTGSFDDNSIIVWETTTGKAKFSFSGTKFKLSPDGNFLFTFGDEATKWNLATGKEIFSIKEKSEDVTISSATLSNDGKWLITTVMAWDNSIDKSAKVWDAQTGKLIRKLKGSDDNREVKSAVFSFNNDMIATSTEYGLFLFETKSGKLLHKLPVKEVDNVEFSSDGKILLTSEMFAEPAIKVWDVKSGKMISTYHSDDYLTTVRLSPEGKTIVVSNSEETILADAATGKTLHTLSGKSYSVWSDVFSPDGKILATKDESIKLWNISTGQLISSIGSYELGIFSVTFSTDGSKILTTGISDYIAKIWDVKSRSLISTLGSKGSWLTSASYSPDGEKIVTVSFNEVLQTWNVKSGQPLLKLEVPFLYSARFSPDGKSIIATTFNLFFGNAGAKVFDAETGEEKFTISHRKTEMISDVCTVDISQDGKKIISSTRGDKVAQILDLYSGEILATLAHEAGVLSARFSPDGTKVITTDESRQPKLWDAHSGNLISALPATEMRMYYAEFSPDGKMVIGGGRGEVVLWDLQKNEISRVLLKEGMVNYSAHFSPDGSSVITYSEYDRAIKIWKTETGKLLNTIEAENVIFSANFSPDGKAVVASTKAGKTLFIKLGKKGQGQLLEGKNAFVTGHSTFSPDGKSFLTCPGDGSLIIRNAETGEKQIQQFSFGDGHITLLPSGYYKATKNATKELYYISPKNQIVTFDQLDIKYNRPDLVLQALGSNDTALIKAYRKAYEKRVKKLEIDTNSFRGGFSFPESDIKNRGNIDFQQEDDELTLRITGYDSAYSIDRFNVWVNESPVFGKNGVSLKNQHTNILDTTITVQLSEGQNLIEASITNVNGIESFRIPLHVGYEPDKPIPANLYFVGIGIDNYADPAHDLSYSVKDIRDLAFALKNKYGENIVIDTLYNSNVTIANVEALKKTLQKTSVHDKVIIAYSGHGLLGKEYDYFLSTHNVDFTNPEKGGIPYELFEDLTDSIKARKKLVLIDACHSGELDREEYEEINKLASADNGLSNGAKGITLLPEPKLGSHNSFELMQNLFLNVQKGTGATIISAAGGTQFAYEKGNLKNGVFTYSILQLMQQEQSVTVQQLKKQVGETVVELTQGMQKPTSRLETNAYDWQVW